MDGNNFFISLSKYRPEIGRDPREDFLTEAFAYLLRLDKELLSQIAEYLLRNSGIVGARVIREISISINKDESVLVWCHINPLTFDSALSCHCERPKVAWQSRFLVRDCFVVNTPRNDSPNVKIC